MLEILHDVAPNAELGFATAFDERRSFADNIRALRFEAGCDVIVDDVLYFNEHPFQDGPIAQSVDAVTADGALYFSSAGNEGNVIDGTSGNYEGDFADSGRGVGKFAGSAHDFDPGPGVQVFEPVSPESSAGRARHAVLGRPARAPRPTTTTCTCSTRAVERRRRSRRTCRTATTTRTRSSARRRSAAAGAAAGGRAVLGRATATSSSPRCAAGSRTPRTGSRRTTTPGVTAATRRRAGAFSTAAAPAAAALPFALEPGDPPNPPGPFPGPFTAAQLPERFTSDGPRRMFFGADGTPITPGDFSSTGGAVRQKPDITAADGVITSVDGFDAVLRHVGGGAARRRDRRARAVGQPGRATADVREAFEATALDLAPAGVDGRTGARDRPRRPVLDYTGATPQPLVRAGAPAVDADRRRRDAYLEPGETATLDAARDQRGRRDRDRRQRRGRRPATRRPRSRRARGPTGPRARRDESRAFRLALARRLPAAASASRCAVRVTFAGTLSPTTTTLMVRDRASRPRRRRRSPTPGRPCRSPTTSRPARRWRSR